MRSRRWLYACAAVLFALASSAGFALQGNGHGRDKHGDHDDDDRGGSVYSDHDRDAMRDWYDDHHDHLPPGLAERDQLPPGMEKQLVVRGTLPPGLRKKIQHCPEDMERRLPPPPPDCEHVVIGGHVVLLNIKSFAVVDVVHFELR
jgi:hypothetical protein